MNLPPRLRFRLNRLRSALRSALGSSDPPAATAHRVCPDCRALIGRDASLCPFCGAPTRSARTASAAGRVLGGLIPIPSTATSVLVAANIALYAISWYLSQAAASSELSPVPAGDGIRGEVLVRLGAKFGPFILAGQWWRLVTAMFLHAGLLHIGMNLWCLFDLGAEAESLFSTRKFVVFYLVTGVAGFLLSFWWSPYRLSVGASGAILGLVGILIGASFHHGQLGKDYRRQLWRWVIYILIFGLLSGILGFGLDNAAHLGGLGSGVLLGYFVPEGDPEARSSENLWNALAVLSVLIIAGSFVLMALQLNPPSR